MKFDPKKIFWTILGGILILLGIIGTFIPLMPGPALIVAGAILLGIERKVLDYYITNYLKKFRKKLK